MCLQTRHEYLCGHSALIAASTCNYTSHPSHPRQQITNIQHHHYCFRCISILSRRHSYSPAHIHAPPRIFTSQPQLQPIPVRVQGLERSSGYRGEFFYIPPQQQNQPIYPRSQPQVNRSALTSAGYNLSPSQQLEAVCGAPSPRRTLRYRQMTQRATHSRPYTAQPQIRPRRYQPFAPLLQQLHLHPEHQHLSHYQTQTQSQHQLPVPPTYISQNFHRQPQTASLPPRTAFQEPDEHPLYVPRGTPSETRNETINGVTTPQIHWIVDQNPGLEVRRGYNDNHGYDAGPPRPGWGVESDTSNAKATAPSARETRSPCQETHDVEGVNHGECAEALDLDIVASARGRTTGTSSDNWQRAEGATTNRESLRGTIGPIMRMDAYESSGSGSSSSGTEMTVDDDGEASERLRRSSISRAVGSGVDENEGGDPTRGQATRHASMHSDDGDVHGID